MNRLLCATLAVAATLGFAQSASAQNAPPVLVAIGNKTVDELSTLTFTATAFDPNPAAIFTYTLDPGSPPGAILNPSTGVFSWIPAESQGPGTFSITLRATNDASPPLSDAKTFTVTVNEVNQAPVLAPIGSKLACGPGTPFAFTATATDADVPVNNLTFSLDPGAPAGATIGASTGAFSWTPFTFGTFPVTVRVTDNGAPPLSDFEVVPITVSTVPNQPPVLGAIGDRTVDELTPLTFTATAFDPGFCEIGPITFSLDAGAPTGAVINGLTGAFSWTPTEAQGPGSYSITVRVTDNGVPALSDFETITVTVREVNLAPIAAANGPYSGSPGSLVTFDGTGSSDPDGDALTYTWNFGDGDTGTGATPSHAYAAAGAYTVTLRVTDPSLLFDEDTTTATIADNLPANVFYWKGLDIIIPQVLGTWVRMEPVGNSFDINSVVLSTLRLTYNGVTIPSLCKSGIKDDSNKNGKVEIRACFRNQEIEPLFAALPNGTTTVTLTLEADLLAGGKARGTTTAKVFKAGWLEAGSMASVSPNPLNPSAKLSFVVMKPGVTTVQVFDINGRLVRNLMQRQYLTPGPYELTVDGRNEQGNKLASGVYYYRLSSADGITKGSLIVMK